jgi:predicted nucleic acid-binding protein
MDPHERLLLDTSVWVRCLRPRGSEGLKEAVREALDQGRIATCWVVKAELLVGARDEAGFNALLDALSGVPEIPISGALWGQTASLGHALRKQGLPTPLPDLLVAQCAISSGRMLWHADAGFERIRQLSSLQTRYWQATD